MPLATKGGAEPLGQPDGVYSAAVTTSASARRRLPMALELSNLSDRSHAPAWERSPGRSGVLLVMTEIVWDGVTRSAPLRKEHKK